MRHTLSNLLIVLALGLGVGVSVEAQQPRDTAGQTVNTVDDDRRDGFEWGWLGLLGLAGLMGMKRKEVYDRPGLRTDSSQSSAATR